MRRLLILGSLLLLMVIAVSTVSYAARIPGIVILVDMSHGQNPGGLAAMMKVVPEAYWVVLVASKEDAEALPPDVKALANEIRVGGFTPDNLKDVDMVIIGQPTKLPTDEEVKAITEWFHKHEGDYRIKALWVAADSDYPAQGSETAQEFANIILKAIGSSLRVDYVSVEEYGEGYYAEKTYRVLGVVDPPPELALLGFACHKVLFHGPGVVAAVAPDGTWVNPLKTPVKNVYVIVHTTEKGKIVEHQPKAPGAPGHMGIVYHPGDEGEFPLLAVEIMAPNEIVIASGESPYSGYQGGITWQYKGYVLDGPRFFRNLVLWATHYMGELKEVKRLYEFYAEVKKLSKEISDLKSSIGTLSDDLATLKSGLDGVRSVVSDLKRDVDSMKGKVSDLSEKVRTLSSDLGSVKSDVGSVKSKIDTLSGKLTTLEKTSNTLKLALGGVSNLASAALGLAIVAIILAIVAIVLAFRKKT